MTLSFALTLQNLSDDRVSVELRVTEKLCLNGFSVRCLAWSKDALSDDRDDSRLLMPAGMFFMVIGGWLLSR